MSITPVTDATGSTSGFGIIQVPHYHVARQLSAGSLREILPDCRPPALPLNVLYPPNRQLSARVWAFIDWLQDLFADLAQ